MKHLRFLFLLFSGLLASTIIKAQYKMSVKETKVRIIDKKVLYDELLAKTEYDFHVISIYTNYCAGTPYMFQRVKWLDSLGLNKVQWIMCSSADVKDSLETLQTLKRYGVYPETVYLIDGKQYKEKRTDDRYKGFMFRKDICEPCKKDIIGVPYYIVFNNKKEIVSKGYLSKNDVFAVIKESLLKKE